MFNTFHPERLQEAIGVERCAFGMPFVRAMLDGDGRLKAVINTAGQKTIMSRQRWVDVFNAAGLPAALEPDMPLWLRCHAPMCVAFESVSAGARRRREGNQRAPPYGSPSARRLQHGRAAPDRMAPSGHAPGAARPCPASCIPLPTRSRRRARKQRGCFRCQKGDHTMTRNRTQTTRKASITRNPDSPPTQAPAAAEDSRADIYQRITDRIAAAIEAGAGKWQMPWYPGADGAAPRLPVNAATGKPYL